MAASPAATLLLCAVVNGPVALSWAPPSCSKLTTCWPRLGGVSRCRASLESSGYSSEDDVPPEVAGDVRDFRARLISRSRAGGLTSGEEAAASKNDVEQSWAYETSLLEQGSVLLGGTTQDFGFALRQQYFHKCVVVLVQHDVNFTKGVIVNRPSQRKLDGWTVWLGGDVCEGGVFAAPSAAMHKSGQRLDVECLTALEYGEGEGCTEVVRGVKRTTFENAKRLVAEGKATQNDFWVFCGYAGWAPGQLAGELERKSWYVAAADGGSLVQELLKQREKAFGKPGTEVDNGVATWESLMRRIGREAEAKVASDRDRLDDDMLRAWVDARLSPLEIDAQAFSKNAAQRARAEEALRRLAGPADAPIARGALVAGVAVESDFVLDRQFLHKSVCLIVASSADRVVAATLNRATKRAVALDLGDRQVLRGVAFGGELAARGAPGGVLWLKLGPLSPDATGDTLAGPVLDDIMSNDAASGLEKRRDRRPHLCVYQDVASALSSGECAVTDLLAIWGVTVWRRDEFARLLGIGALVPLDHHSFPWRDIFDLHDHALPADDDAKRAILLDDGSAVWHRALCNSKPLLPDDPSPAATDYELADRALQSFREYFFD